MLDSSGNIMFRACNLRRGRGGGVNERNLSRFLIILHAVRAGLQSQVWPAALVAHGNAS